jgi:uncharacterized protein (TIGR00288 family)
LRKKIKGIAFFVNGPDVLSHKKNVDMQKTIKKIKEDYEVRVAKVYLDQFASDKLIEAVNNQGYESNICISDVNVSMSIGIMEEVHNPNIESIAIMTSNQLFTSVMKKVKEHKKKIILVCEKEAPKELAREADRIIVVK